MNPHDGYIFWMWYNFAFFALNAWMATWKSNRFKILSGVAAAISLICAFSMLNSLKRG